MKKLTIALGLIALAFIAFACKKKKSQYCYWLADISRNSAYVWEYTKPTDAQVQKVKDSCQCTFTIIETCLPCKPQTDSNGNDIPCD